MMEHWARELRGKPEWIRAAGAAAEPKSVMLTRLVRVAEKYSIVELWPECQASEKNRIYLNCVEWRGEWDD